MDCESIFRLLMKNTFDFFWNDLVSGDCPFPLGFSWFLWHMIHWHIIVCIMSFWILLNLSLNRWSLCWGRSLGFRWKKKSPAFGYDLWIPSCKSGAFCTPPHFRWVDRTTAPLVLADISLSKSRSLMIIAFYLIRI